MKERSSPDNYRGEIKPTIFRGEEYPSHFHFDPYFEDLPLDEFYDGMVIGSNRNWLPPTPQGYKAPSQILVWEQGGVTAMTEGRYKKKYVEVKIK